MSGRIAMSFGLLWFGTLVSSLVGCAGMSLPDAPTEDIAETRRLRAEEATRHFETSHDFAQLQDAAARWKRGDAKGCEEGLRRLLARNPNHREARLFLADIRMTDGQKNEAIEDAQAVLAAHPEDPDAARIVRRTKEGDWVTSTDHADRDTAALSANEATAASHSATVGEANVGEDRPIRALRPSNTDANNPYNLQESISAAREALRANEPARALRLLAAARQQSPNTVVIHRMIGVAHYRTGDFKSSQVALQQALSLDNSAAVTYFLLGCTQAKLGHVESAEENFRRAREIDPTYSSRP